MSAKSKPSSLLLKVGIVVAVLVVAGIVIPRALRPVVHIEDVVSGVAIDAKPGNVSVTAEYGMEIKSEVPGRVMADGYNVDPGQPVKKGEVLVRIDPSDLENEMDQIRTDLKAAKRINELGAPSQVDLESAEADEAQGEKSFKFGSISQLDLDKLKRVVESWKFRVDTEKIDADQKVETYENQLKAKQLALDRMTIHAEIDGIISQVYAHPGDLIGPNASIATLIKSHKVVIGTIAEEDFANVQVGQKVSVIFDTYGSWVYNGTVTKILPTADASTQRQQIYIDVTDIAPEKLIPGITGEMSVTVGEHEAKTIVPRKSVLGDYLFVVNDGIVYRRGITKGFTWLTGVEVLSGLEPGDQVITEDLDKVHVGEHVSVVVDPPDALSKPSNSDKKS